MLKHQDLTEQIIAAFYHIYNVLGYGFRESVYRNALAIELINRGLGVQVEEPIAVFYKGAVVGKYYADIIVQQLVIIELKAVEAICEDHEKQLINYLKATRIEVGLVVNFGPKPTFKRKVFENDRKPMLEPDPDF
jgi:GxxExxY protein